MSFSSRWMLWTAAVTSVAAGNAVEPDMANKCPAMARWQQEHPHPEPNAASPQAGAKNAELQTHLLTRYQDEQQAIAALVEARDRGTPSDAAQDRLRRIGADNLHFIKQTIADRGFPQPADVGADGTFAAFMLVQHADNDHAFQQRVLPAIEKLSRSHTIPSEMYAYLFDRVLVGEDRPQRFGTQVYPVDGILKLRPLEDPARVDARRHKIGLPPLADYICLVKAKSGLDVVVPVNDPRS